MNWGQVQLKKIEKWKKYIFGRTPTPLNPCRLRSWDLYSPPCWTCNVLRCKSRISQETNATFLFRLAASPPASAAGRRCPTWSGTWLATSPPPCPPPAPPSTPPAPRPPRPRTRRRSTAPVWALPMQAYPTGTSLLLNHIFPFLLCDL